VVVSELIPAVVTWNREHLGHLTDMPLEDPRVSVEIEDVFETMIKRTNTWDAILLDVDNGPDGLTRRANDHLYVESGLAIAFSALRSEGILSIWSSGADPAFTRRLKQCGFRTEVVTVGARKTGKGGRHTIWLAAKP
jgi:spermidine synthase